MILKGDKLIEEFEDEYEIHYAPREGKEWFSDEEESEIGWLSFEPLIDQKSFRMNNIKNIMLHLDINSTSELKKGHCEFRWDDVLVCPILDESHDPSFFLVEPGIKKEDLEKMDLLRIDYRSPNSTWANMCGEAGVLYICKKTKQQIHFYCSMMN